MDNKTEFTHLITCDDYISPEIAEKARKFNEAMKAAGYALAEYHEQVIAPVFRELEKSLAEYAQSPEFQKLASTFAMLSEIDAKATQRQRSKEDVQRKRRGRDQFGRKIPR